MILNNVADEIATRLSTIAGLRAYGYPPDIVQVPCAVVSWPEDIAYDLTYGRGSDRMTLPVVVLVGKVSDRTTQDRLSQYADGSGSASIKAVLESGTYTAFDFLRVTNAEFDVLTHAGPDYMAGLFTLDIVGDGNG